MLQIKNGMLLQVQQEDGGFGGMKQNKSKATMEQKVLESGTGGRKAER
jgi:hypothetical protein